MNVIVVCECSGVVRDAFIKAGHNLLRCDLLPSETEGPHIQGDARGVLTFGWDLMIAHPDCTYLCSSGLHWNHRRPGRDDLTEAALQFVRELMNAPIKRKCIENPQGRIGTAIRKADQYIQPNQFGHDASKKTGLWLENLPLLKPTCAVAPRYVNGRARWANQTDSGQNKLAPSATRWLDRARTYQGIADAMAQQWGAL